MRKRLQDLTQRLPGGEVAIELREEIKGVEERLGGIEEALYQTRNESRQDPLNFPIRLTDKLAGVKGVAAMGAFAPTAQSYAVRDGLTVEIEGQLEEWRSIRDRDLPRIDSLADEVGVRRVRTDG